MAKKYKGVPIPPFSLKWIELYCSFEKLKFHSLSFQEIATVVLDPLVLGVARAYRNDMLGGGRQIEPNKANRHAAYRQFVLWHYGRLGNRNRRAIPSCVVCRIRDTFPDPFGIYVGYIPGRLV